MRVPDADLRRTCCAWGRTPRPRPQLARQVVEELKGICGGAHRAGPARDLGSSALLLLVSRETLGDEQVDEHLEALGCSSGCSGSRLLANSPSCAAVRPPPAKAAALLSWQCEIEVWRRAWDERIAAGGFCFCV